MSAGEGYEAVPTFRTHGYVELPVGVLLGLMMLVLTFLSMMGLGMAQAAQEPIVYRSAVDGRCIRVVQYRSPSLSCEVLPSRYTTVVVSDADFAETGR